MLRGMTPTQFLEWLEYARLEPFDEKRADYRAAQIVQYLLMVNLPKGAKVPSLDELVLKWGSSPKKKAAPEDDWRRMKALTQMIAEAYKD